MSSIPNNHVVGVVVSSSADERLLFQFLKAQQKVPLALDSGRLDLQRDEDVSLIIADESVARASGRQLLKYRWRYGNAYTPILIALNADTDSAPWLRIGFDDVIRMPIEQAELRARLAMHLRLREQLEKRYDAFFQNALIGIFRREFGRGFLMANPALLNMMRVSSVQQLNRQDGVLPDRPEERERLESALIEHGRVAGFETRWITADADAIDVRINAIAISDHEDQPVGYEATVEDITETKAHEKLLRAAREEAEAASRAKSVFLANMSHELRTPLTGIIGFSTMMARQVPDEHKRYARLVEQSGRRLMGTLDGVLTLAKLESEGPELDFELVDVAEAIRDVIDTLASQAAHKGLQFVQDLPDERLLGWLDRDALSTVLQRLIGNAVKFTDQGQVEVSASRSGSSIRIAVRDSGCGISPDFLPHVFEPFHQESSGPARSHEGTGLGLSIARRLVVLMNGEIDLDSRRGEGTEFTVLFPAADALDAEHQEQSRVAGSLPQ